ncbi:hypothetical protein PHJA_000836300 [Phtheirospermum japonicum]|uniref:Pectinesterase inhibitor domain-containing protein n=1 Tax=Phtheirospermum japonicum TaxID=374723 RepID=A0A830BTF1_9LAMI|nr:hypothetical protein PHJA_000836300 [Phtheirospermum japonicum]
MSNIIVTSSSDNLIEQACSNPRLDAKSQSCVQILESQPKIVSAKNLYELSIAIMKSGISSATDTRKYIEKLLDGPAVGPDSKSALQNCKTSYDDVIASFNSALDEVKDDKEFDTATYDLLIGCTDTFQPCLDAAGKINDPTISSANDATLIYALSAYQAIDNIPTMSVIRSDN